MVLCRIQKAYVISRKIMSRSLKWVLILCPRTFRSSRPSRPSRLLNILNTVYDPIFKKLRGPTKPWCCYASAVIIIKIQHIWKYHKKYMFKKEEKSHKKGQKRSTKKKPHWFSLFLTICWWIGKNWYKNQIYTYNTKICNCKSTVRKNQIVTKYASPET